MHRVAAQLFLPSNKGSGLRGNEVSRPEQIWLIPKLFSKRCDPKEVLGVRQLQAAVILQDSFRELMHWGCQSDPKILSLSSPSIELDQFQF